MFLPLFLLMASYACELPACEPAPPPTVRACAADEGCEEVWGWDKEVPLS